MVSPAVLGRGLSSKLPRLPHCGVGFADFESNNGFEALCMGLMIRHPAELSVDFPRHPLKVINMFGMPGLPELLIIGVVLLLLFGKRVPATMRSLGQSIVEFKRGVKGIDEDIETETRGPSAKPTE